MPTTTEPPPAEIAAGAPERPAVVPVSTAVPAPTAPLTLARVASLVASANRGEITTERVRAEIQAALADVKTTGIASIVQPAYRSQIVPLIDHGRPLINAISSSPLPGSGMSIEYPQWLVPPAVDVQSAEKAEITSVAATMEMKTAAVLTWAGGNDISLQAVERSSPSFLEAYLRAMAVDFARKTDTYVATTLLAAATAATAGADFVANVAAMFAALDPTTTPPGQMFLAMGWGVGTSMIGPKRDDAPAFWDASISLGTFLPNETAAGLAIFVDPNMPTDMMLLGSRQAATWHESAGAPADIRVVDVSLLGLDVGVYGYGALTIEYPGALVKLDTVA
jgi:hypothetical protein